MANTKQVPCSPQGGLPENAQYESFVTITWNDGSWSVPEGCPWRCKSGYHKEGNTCEKDTTSEYCFGFSNGTITSYQWHNCPSDVIIPKRINGVPVTAIGERAFAGWTEEIYGDYDEW